ncbi:hypothetical protein C2857_006077 [Epichloe festucae Fl1]|uniref:FHA domain-containing protein n=1 Tax=Epichloe festucae (strain Fl1) TaxID=877507 RepID=A0A7S9KQ17_EPIFF|nr:hypothetical protein C2857_006077 [Epichloe festucae Fl1]
MAVEPHYTDEVQVALKSINTDPENGFFDRHILLTKYNTKADIGRSTKRDARLAAQPNNGWFDSPVMSRSHARLLFCPKLNSISVMDIGSLHGTYVNNSRVVQRQVRKLTSGDILRFGAPIQKGRDIFQACEVKVVLKQGSSNPGERPLVFKVPDSTDDEDNISDVDEAVDSSVAILRRAGMASSRPEETATVSTIDLTEGEASAVKHADPSGIKELSDETTPDDKPVLERDRLRWIPETIENLDDESESGTSLHNSNSSIVVDTDEESSYSNKDEHHDDERCVRSEYVAVESDFDHNNSHEEDSAAQEATGSLQAVSDQKNSPDAQTFAIETSVPSPRSANVDAVSMFVISRPLANHPESCARDSSSAQIAKAEYFAAREHNRQVHLSHGDKLEETTQRSSVDIAEDDGPSVSFSTSHPTTNIFGPSESSTCTTTAALLASGEKFLPTPIVEESPAEGNVLEDLFDDASAFSYETSKKTVRQTDHNTILPEIEKTGLTNEEDVELPPSHPPDAKRPSRKRKSGDISALLPAEVEPHSSQTQLESSQPVINLETPAAWSSDGPEITYTDLASSSERPVKRLRRAAEILGYAALGGVAVMSALIATAPAL